MPDGKIRICSGSLVKYGPNSGDCVVVAQAPGVVRQSMLDSEEHLLEFTHHKDPEVPVYIDRRVVRVITPLWDFVEVPDHA